LSGREAGLLSSALWSALRIIGVFLLQLLPALVIAQSMIEEALLPFDPILSSVKMFPIANDTAHRSVPLKGQQRVNVIGHEEKKCDVPAKFGVIEFRGLK
jgi:hypothetical protein